MTTENASRVRALHSGHQIAVSDFLGDIVRLVACIQAGPNASMIWRRLEHDPDHQLARFQQITQTFLSSEIPRLLISVAATLRTKIDDGSWRVNSHRYIGWLSHGEQVDMESGESIDVHEACNKIIHAKRVHPERTTSDDGVQSIGSVVTISGDRSGKPWAVELNLLAFCIAVANIEFFPTEQ